MTARLRTIAAIAVTASAFANPATSAERSIAFSGLEGGGSQAYVYAGLLQPWSATQGRWSSRYWLDAQRYEYAAEGRTISATALSLTPSLVRHVPVANGRLALSAGLRLADTTLRPADPDNEEAGLVVSVPLQVDGAVWLGNKAMSGIVTVVPQSGSYWSRLRLMQPSFSTTLDLGIELVALGGADYASRRIGLLLAQPGKRSVLLKLGLAFEDGGERSAFLGLEWHREIGD